MTLTRVIALVILVAAFFLVLTLRSEPGVTISAGRSVVSCPCLTADPPSGMEGPRMTEC